ncbi:MAG: DUF433 domain-containing protein, partial [Chloroflexi bacterium]
MQLADKFHRITIDPDNRNGFPCIRGLPITVYDIVRLSNAGKSQEEIIHIHPDLESEDIHQALAYTVSEMHSAIGIYHREALVPWTSINGWSQIMDQTDRREVDLDGESVKISLLIRRNAHKLRRQLNYLSIWVKQSFENTPHHSQSASIHAIIDELAEHDSRVNSVEHV